MVRTHELLARELVEPLGEALGGPARVAEHDRGSVRADELEHPRVHVRPDALVGLRRGEVERARTRLRHVVDGDDHLDVEVLARTGVDDGDRPCAVLGLAAEEAGDLVEGALRGREADALRRRVGDRVEPFERQREVRAPLGGRERVDLVDDHRLDAAQDLAGLRGEHEIQRLGRGDEDVGRGPCDVPAFLRRRVAGAHRHGGGGEGRADPLGRERDPREWRPQVLLDVDGEGAERRDVEHPAPFRLGRHLGGAEAVDRGEERGEGLARPGGREQEGVVAGRDGRPALRLGAGGRGEAGLEPGPRGRREAAERRLRHRPTVPAGSDRPVGHRCPPVPPPMT